MPYLFREILRAYRHHPVSSTYFKFFGGEAWSFGQRVITVPASTRYYIKFTESRGGKMTIHESNGCRGDDRSRER